MQFFSEAVASIHSTVVEAFEAVTYNSVLVNGVDDTWQILKEKLSDIFEKEVFIHLPPPEVAANYLALAAISKPGQGIYCHREDYANAEGSINFELMTAGGKMRLLDGDVGQISLASLENTQQTLDHIHLHKPDKPQVLSISQGTEYGTVYSLKKLQSLTSFAKKNSLFVHMNGVRFTNALVSLGLSPAQMTWKAGVDVLSFGGIKNGAMCVEAIIFFDEKKHTFAIDYIQKRSGQMAPKMQYFAAQFLAYLQDDLWLKNARHGNLMAQELVRVFKQHGINPVFPVDINEIFVYLPIVVAQRLWSKGVHFHEWLPVGSNLYRFVTSFSTQIQELEMFKHALKESLV